MRRRLSQADLILRLLKASGQGWVSAVELGRVSLQYCSRVAEIRARGIAVENRVMVRDGVRHGFYRLRQQPHVVVGKPVETRYPDLLEGKLFTEQELRPALKNHPYPD
jgi:hypothetical protein